MAGGGAGIDEVAAAADVRGRRESDVRLGVAINLVPTVRLLDVLRWLAVDSCHLVLT